MTEHVVRIRRFSNAALGTPADLEALIAAARRDYPQNFIQRFVGHHVHVGSGVFMITVRWLGWGAGAEVDGSCLTAQLEQTGWVSMA